MRAIIIVVLLVFISCKKTTEDTPKTFELYQYSEMALYMHSIYDMHQEIKESIQTGEQLPALELDLDQLYSAEMSDRFVRNESFEGFSRLYLQQVALIYDTLSEVSVKERYNNAVHACIACHQTTCLGPIPKIKKLLIH